MPRKEVFGRAVQKFASSATGLDHRRRTCVRAQILAVVRFRPKADMPTIVRVQHFKCIPPCHTEG